MITRLDLTFSLSAVGGGGGSNDDRIWACFGGTTDNQINLQNSRLVRCDPGWEGIDRCPKDSEHGQLQAQMAGAGVGQFREALERLVADAQRVGANALINWRRSGEFVYRGGGHHLRRSRHLPLNPERVGRGLQPMSPHRRASPVRRPVLPPFGSALCAGLLALLAAAEIAAQSTELEVGRTLPGTLAAGDTARYTIEASENDFVLGEVNQISVDVTARVLDPEGTQVGRFGGLGRGGPALRRADVRRGRPHAGTVRLGGR